MSFTTSDKFFVIERPEKPLTISKKKPKKYFDTDIFEKYSQVRNNVSTSKNATVRGDKDKIKNLQKIFSQYLGSNYLIQIFNMKQDFNFFNYDKIIKNSKSNYKQKSKAKFTNIMSTMTPYEEIQHLHMCNREKTTTKYWLHRYLVAFRHLKPNGNMLLPLINFCHPETVDLLYLSLLLFKKLIIYRGIYVYFEDFTPLIKETSITSLLTTPIKPFTVTPKPELKALEKYLLNNYTKLYKFNNNLLNKKYELVVKEFYIDILQKLEDTNNPEIYNEALVKIYQEFYDTFKHFLIGDKLVKIHSGIKTPEGKFLTNLVTTKNLNKIVEVGMAFGISAMFITEGIKHNKKSGKLISIDPFQTEQWKDSAINLLKTLKLSKYSEVIQKKSYIALPELLISHGENSFDTVFIDGWHTFDYTLLDTFYADKLVKPNGYIIIDDALHFSVQQCIRYIDTNYKHLERIKAPKTFAAYKKIKNDDREWNFHIKF